MGSVSKNESQTSPLCPMTLGWCAGTFQAWDQPILIKRMVRVSNRHRQRVAKGRRTLLEAYAVLPPAGVRFRVIPLER